MAKGVNQNDLNIAVLSNKQIKKQAFEIAQSKLEKAKNELINDFGSHSVSREIKAGPSSTNISGTLGGYGNLFSFIGFDAGNNPVDLWIAFLKNKIQIKNKNPKTSESGDKILFEFDVNGVSDADLTANAQMPWELGRSWIKSIEQGISGFSFYISKKLGRSGGGIQADNKVRSGQYQRKQYWSSMWKKFLIDLK
jgi:hypothetical protein